MAKKKHHHAPTLSPETLARRTEGAAEEGRFQHALELGKQLYKQSPTPAHLELLRRVTLGRAQQLRGQGHDRDANTVLENAVALADADTAWLEKIALEMAGCGNIRRAFQLLAHVPPSPAHAEVTRRAADASLQQGRAGRDLLPEPLQAQHDLIVTAFAQQEAGQDDQARETLQGIGLQSPFLEWKLLLRGLLAYYQNEELRAVENWQRLDPQRLPARLVAPLRLLIDPAYREAQPQPVQVTLKKQADRLQDQGLLPQLRAAQSTLANPEQMPQAFRVAENLVPALRRQQPHLVNRLAHCFFWAIIHHGEPPDVARYERVFGAPAEDPRLSRLRALLAEQLHDPVKAHAEWQEFEKAVASNPGQWPAGQADRIRALVWRRMGNNAATIPTDEQAKLLPDFLRDHPSRPRPLKPPADVCYQRSLELAPDQLETHLDLFEHYRGADKPKKAIAAGRKLLEHFPRHAPTLLALGDLLLGESAYAEALDCYRRALEANPLDQGIHEKISTAHLFQARTHAEAGRFEEARAEYQAALDTGRTRQDFKVYCKWAAAEFKAGNAERAEELMAQALAGAGNRLAVAFNMVIEVIRLKLTKLKKRFNDDFNRALTEPPTAEAAAAIVQTAAAHRLAKIEYYGQKTHEKKVLTYLEKAKKVDFSEEPLLQVCRGLLDLSATKLLQIFAALGHRHFPSNPRFPFLEAESYIAQGPYRCPSWKVGPLLEKAEQLAQKLPPDNEQKALLEEIQNRKQLLGVQGLFTGYGGFGPFGGFLDPLDYFDEDDDYEDQDWD